MHYIEFSKEINRLKKSKNFSQVLSFFEEHKRNYLNEQIKSDKWLVSAIITSIRKIGNSKFVGVFLNEYNILINDELDPMVVNAYGWCLYENLKNTVYQKNQIISILSTPVFLIQRNIDEFSKTLLGFIFESGLKIGKSSANLDYQYIYNFCRIFDKNFLSIEENCFEKNGKNICLASNREKWFSEMSKATYELKFFEECYHVSKEAIDNIDNFHNNNDLWLARRIALSKKELGNLDDAIDDLKRVYSKKREWFLQKEIAELYYEKEDLKSAFEYATAAINPIGKLEYKIGLIFLIGRILRSLKKIEESNYHFLLVKRIREENNWKIPEKLSQYFNDDIIQNKKQTKEIINILEKYWSSINNTNKNSFRKEKAKNKVETGVIKKILNDNERGKNGFIESDIGDIYFNIPKNYLNKDLIYAGQKVSFTVKRYEDGKTIAQKLKCCK